MDPVVATLSLPDGSIHSASGAIAMNADPSWARFDGQGGKSLGMHVYAGGRAAIVVGTIRISNGAVSPDGSGHPGFVYFNSLRLRAPAGWTWVTLPQAGESVSGQDWTIAAKPQNGSHLFRSKAILERPYALVQVGNAVGMARAAAHLRYKTLEIPSPVVNYGPTMSTQPAVDRFAYEMAFAGAASQLLSAQQQGTAIWLDGICGIERPAMGPWWFDGEASAGAPGGFEIDTSHGYEQCRSSVLAHAITYRANLGRQFCGMYHAQTGKPMSLWEWTVPLRREKMRGEQGDLEDHYEIHPFFTGNSGSERYKRFNQGTCAYEGELNRYQGHDCAHGIRFMEDCVPLIEYTNDPAVKDSLIMAATYWQTTHWADRSDELLTDPQNPNDYRPSSLSRARDDAQRNPHRAGWFDRNYGWMCYAGACAIKYLPAGPLRERWKAWGKNMIDTGVLAADKFGFTMREQRDELPQGVHGLIAFHEGINVLGMFALDRQANGASTAPVAELLKRKCKSLFVDLPPLVDEWNPVFGPFHWIGTEKNGQELNSLSPQYCTPPGDPAHVLSACALAHRASGDVAPLSWSLKLMVPHQTLQQRLAWCKTRTDRAATAEYESVLAKHLGVA